MTALIVAAVGAGIVLPHVLRLERADPLAAVALWVGSLTLRALTAIFLVLYVFLFLPGTSLFGELTHWCLHASLPLLTDDFGLEGDRVGDAATILPAFLLFASALSVGFGVVRAARSVRRLVRGHAVGAGPAGSVIVTGADVLLAAAGLARPTVVVSAGALTQLDDDELAAGLAHERGHIVRHHRWIMVAAEVCRALGRVVPGSAIACREIGFHLERDADRWTLAQRHDPLALASAISKAATSTTTQDGVAFATLTGTGTAARLALLLEDGGGVARRGRSVLVAAVAAACLAVTLATAALVPVTAAAGIRAERQQQPGHVHHCHHHHGH